MQNKKTYQCLHCHKEVVSFFRPDKCPACGKTSHERQRGTMVTFPGLDDPDRVRTPYVAPKLGKRALRRRRK